MPPPSPITHHPSTPNSPTMRYLAAIVWLASPASTSAFLLTSLFQWLFGPDCPDITSVDDFDLDAYIAKTWYIQRQQTNSYQDEDSLFCLAATYDLEGKKQWYKEAITVRNYNNDGGVNQNPTDSDFVLCATRTSRPGKLGVAPCFLPPFLAGPYWVVATDYDNYAIVTGGNLVKRGPCGDDDLCTTREKATILDPLSFAGNNQGLWFLTRQSVAPPELLEEMEDVAASLGICTAGMLPVTQEGCTYEGAIIKS